MYTAPSSCLLPRQKYTHLTGDCRPECGTKGQPPIPQLNPRICADLVPCARQPWRPMTWCGKSEKVTRSQPPGATMMEEVRCILCLIVAAARDRTLQFPPSPGRPSSRSNKMHDADPACTCDRKSQELLFRQILYSTARERGTGGAPSAGPMVQLGGCS